MTFEGYSAEALDFLAQLPTHDAPWFKSKQKEYVRLVAAPTKALVTELGDRLAGVLPNIVAQPKTNGSISPINNDLRFSPNKSPYKDHVLIRFWEGADKKTAASLYVRIAPDNVGFATGIMPASVDAWREFVAGKAGGKLDAAVKKLASAKHADVVGQELKRVPAPYPADHPRADLLRHKMLQLRWPEDTPAEVHTPQFVDWCLNRLRDCLPVHRLLVEAGL